MTLTSSFIRAALKTACVLILLLGLTAVEEHWRTGHWWTREYIQSLWIPFPLFIAFVWILMPRRITLTEDHLYIERPFLPNISIPMDDLQYFMNSPTFMIQVSGQTGAYQISKVGFTWKEWRAFIRELTTRFPRKRAWYGIGAFLFGPRDA